MIDAINHWGSSWAGYFGFAVLQNTVFLGLVFIALHLLRHKSAQLRYMLCVVGLIKLLLPPFVPVHLGAPAAQPLPLAGVIRLVAGESAVSVPATAADSGMRLSLLGSLFVGWLVLLGLYGALAAISTLRLRRMLASATRVGCAGVTPGGGRRAIDVYRSDRIAMPLTPGLLSRSIFVPAAWDGWTDRCRGMVIRHELAHIRRLDGLTQVFQVIAQAAYIFNPLVWLLNRRMNQYREMACDDEAIGGLEGDSVEYSRYLVDIAEMSVKGSALPGPVTAMVGPGNGLLKRIQYQMKEGKMKLTTTRQRVIILAGLLLLILPMSWYCSKGGPEDDAEAVARHVLEQKPKVMRKVEVVVKSEQEIMVDGVSTTLEGLVETLNERAGEHAEEPVIVLSVGPDLEMGAVMAVRDVLVDLGLNKVMFVGGPATGLPLVLPSKDNMERLAQMPERNVAILIALPGGKIMLEGEYVGISDLKAILEKRLAENDSLVVHIHTVTGTPYPDFFEILRIAKEAGAQRISFD